MGDLNAGAKVEDWAQCIKELQKIFVENRRVSCKNVNGKEGRELKLGVKSKEGILLAEIGEVEIGGRNISENRLLVMRGR